MCALTKCLFRIGTRDCYVPPISGVGGQFGEIISGPRSGFRVYRSTLSDRPQDSYPADYLLDKLQRDLGAIRKQILITPRELQSFLGLINFLAPIVDLGRLHMHPIQLWLTPGWDYSLSSIDLPVRVTPIFWKRLRYGWIQIGYSKEYHCETG